MAEQDDTELLLDDEVLDDPEQEDAEHLEADGEQQPDDEIAIEIEGEEQADETPLIKQLRAELRDTKKEASELRKATAPIPIVVGNEPDLWDDCEGDPDRYKTELLAWNARKAKAEQQQHDAERTEQVGAQEFQRSHVAYKAKAELLGVKDFQASEDAVCAALPMPVQNAIVQYMQDPAKLVYALGKHPAKLAEIAAQTDPLRAILMLHDLEKKVVVNRRKPPSPESETIERGTVAIGGASDKVLAGLEKEAARTGIRTKLVAYKAANRK
jgi:hypothetical protein